MPYKQEPTVGTSHRAKWNEYCKLYFPDYSVLEATPEASRRRCPFLLNLLAAAGVVQTDRQKIHVIKFVLLPSLAKSSYGENEEQAAKRLRFVQAAWPNREADIPADDLSILRELFGKEFLTDEYVFQEATIKEEL